MKGSVTSVLYWADGKPEPTTNYWSSEFVKDMGRSPTASERIHVKGQGAQRLGRTHIELNALSLETLHGAGGVPFPVFYTGSFSPCLSLLRIS